MWNPFKKKDKEILVLSKRSFTQEDAQRIEIRTGKIVILSEDVSDVKLATLPETGDGKAEFISSGTEEEYIDFKREEEGTKGWYERLKNL